MKLIGAPLVCGIIHFNGLAVRLIRLRGREGVIVWLVRLESSVKMNTKLLNELDIEFKNHRREIWGRADTLRDLINGQKRQ